MAESDLQKDLKKIAEEVSSATEDMRRAAKKAERRERQSRRRSLIAGCGFLIGALGLFGGYNVVENNRIQNAQTHIEQSVKQQLKPLKRILESQGQLNAHIPPSKEIVVSNIESKLDRLKRTLQDFDEKASNQKASKLLGLINSLIAQLETVADAACTPELRQQAHQIIADLYAITTAKYIRREPVHKMEVTITQFLVKFLKQCAPAE
jgi:hypothetical protein